MHNPAETAKYIQDPPKNEVSAPKKPLTTLKCPAPYALVENSLKKKDKDTEFLG